jgi:hypothetical protein
LAALGGVATEPLFVAGERVAAELVGVPDGLKATLGGPATLPVGAGGKVVGDPPWDLAGVGQVAGHPGVRLLGHLRSS